MSEIVTLAGGCFWCLEAVYDELEGVTDVVSGYSGGHTHNPSYEAVCSETTGHAEVIQVTFDPHVISLKEILEVFFSIHDPTTLNRQGNDVGESYRSAFFYRSDEQKGVALEVMAEVAPLWGRPLVTQLEPFTVFYPAEDYHQEYFKRNPYQGYCLMVVAPKVAKFRKTWANKLRTAV